MIEVTAQCGKTRGQAIQFTVDDQADMKSVMDRLSEPGCSARQVLINGAMFDLPKCVGTLGNILANDIASENGTIWIYKICALHKVPGLRCGRCPVLEYTCRKPMVVKNFTYDGFAGRLTGGEAGYMAVFKEWTDDPGVAVCKCTDGKERLIPTFALDGWRGEDHPPQNNEGKQLYTGKPCHS